MKTLTSLFLLFGFSFILSTTLYANPFKGTLKKTPTLSTDNFTLIDHFYTVITLKQRSIKYKISSLIRRLKKGESGHLFFWILGMTFLYGIIHAAGPGHGKSIIFSYLMGKKNPQLSKTILLCWFVPFAQGISAMIVIYGIYYLSLGSLVTTFQTASHHANLISYVLILAIGVFLLGLKLYEKYKSHTYLKDEQSILKLKKSNLPLILTLGITPCPGVMILLTFLLAMHLNKLAIALVFSMTTGMAVTISLIGLLTVYSKKKILGTLSSKGDLLHHLEEILEFLGAGLLILFGTILIFSYFNF